MKKAVLISILCLLYCAMTFPDTIKAQSSIDAYILQKMKDYDMPGVGISYIKDGKIAMAKGYGYANIKQDIPFTQHTIMGIASISKTITSTAAMQLWERGLLNLEDPINDYLPFSIVNPFYPNDTITILMLLNHTSSMGFGNTLINGVIEQPTVLPGHGESFDSFLRSHMVPGGNLYTDTVSFLNQKPGYGYSYSNFSMTVLAYIIEIITGQPFNEYCKANIFEPLCMENTACYYSELDTTIVARTYAGEHNLTDFPLWEWSEYPGVGIKSTVTDVSRLMLMHLNYGQIDGARIIDSTTEVMMRTIQFVREETYIPHDDQFIPVQVAQCLGMDLITEHSNNDLQIFGKSGQDWGLCTRSYFIPAENTLITAFANSNIGDGINLPLIDILLELHFLDHDSISTIDKAELNCEAYQPCQHHQLYWSKQSEWSVNSIPMVIGTAQKYDKDQVLALFNEPQNNDASIVLGQALATAKLNIAQGSELSPVLGTINAAMAMIGEERLPYKHPVPFSSSLGQEMLTLAETLEKYNSGELNANPCSGELATSLFENIDHSNSSITFFPNPVTTSATISFTLPNADHVSAYMFDSRGSKISLITNEDYPAGKNNIIWNASSMVPGAYFLKICSGSINKIEKIIVAQK